MDYKKKVHVEADLPVLAQAINGSEHDLSITQFISIKKLLLNGAIFRKIGFLAC
jgi:hypothetical protein